MPYKNKKKQNEYLRKWRAKKQRERLQKEKNISKTFFSLYFSENPKKETKRVRWLLNLVFDRALEKEEAQPLMGHFEFFPQQFLEALLVCWKERGFREVSVLQFIEEILLSPSWEACPECGKPLLPDTRPAGRGTGRQ